jgi:predicted O-linked N-acetylglucosamine transferase (SPINDLY family)
MTHGELLQLIASADVVLDTLHYGGGANSTYDALATGTPLVTMPTEFHRGRYAAAAYQIMDLADLVATSSRDYVERAVALAGQPDLRHEVQSRIRQRRDVLFDNLAAVRELEGFFERAIERARR